jgi:hypothetical protein
VSGEPVGQDAKGSWDWLRFAAGLPASPYPFTAQTSNLLLLSGRWIVKGVSWANPTAGGGLMNMLDGQDATGTMFYTQGYATGQSFTQALGGDGLLMEQGVFLVPGGGTLTGAVWAIPLWAYDITPPGN